MNKADSEFFRNIKGEIEYFHKCQECVNKCKQSWKIVSLTCSRFKKAR